MARMKKAVLIGCVTLAGVVWPGSTGCEEGAPVPQTIELGDVRFHHGFHADALELPCVQCHHETNAAELDIPHTDYFEDLWIDCKICHRPEPPARGVQTCGSCHRANPFDIADETLSAKVVIHRSCWSCHDVGKGEQASRSCATCHAAKRTENS